jgi:hypothetical protein
MFQKSLYKSSLTAVAMISVMAFAHASHAALVNGTFEANEASGGDVYGATGWTVFENVLTNATDGPNFGPVSHDAGGTQSLKMYGPFYPGGASGAFQNMPGTAGTTYQLDAWVMNWAGDPFGNLGILQLNFLDSGGNALAGGVEVTVNPFGTADVDLSVIQDGADISDWTALSLSAIAPAGTVAVQAFLLHIQTGDPCCSGGSLFWDDVSLTEVPAVPVPAAVWLFGSGLLGLVGVARHRRS